MSALTLTACDACGVAAPEDYSGLFPGWFGWLGLAGFDGRHGKHDFCSQGCLAVWLADRGVKMPTKRRAV